MCTGNSIFFIFHIGNISIFRTADNTANITGIIVCTNCCIIWCCSSCSYITFICGITNIRTTASITSNATGIGCFNFNSCNVAIKSCIFYILCYRFCYYFLVIIILPFCICCMIWIIIRFWAGCQNRTGVGNILYGSIINITCNAAYIITTGNVKLVINSKSIFIICIITNSCAWCRTSNATNILPSTCYSTKVISFTANRTISDIAYNATNIINAVNSTGINKPADSSAIRSADNTAGTAG